MLDKFSCGLFTTDIKSGEIEYTNHYVCNELAYHKDELTGLNLNTLFSKATLIFLESYLYPTLIKERELLEVQITVVNKKQQKIPVIANVNLQDNKIFWSIFTAVNRDKLYQELLDARDKLEKQAETLQLAATTDPLTSLLNRRAAGIRIKDMIEQTLRSELPLSFIMVDIDHFKRINDKLGHQRGDEILVQVGKILSHICRSSDIAARWGGEEFLIVLYDTDFENARDFCERLHRNLNTIYVFDKTLTVSIGLATYDRVDRHHIEIETIFSEIDKLLYAAKNNGRNRTEAINYTNNSDSITSTISSISRT